MITSQLFRTLKLVVPAIMAAALLASPGHAQPAVQNAPSDWHSIFRYLQEHRLPLQGVVGTGVAARQLASDEIIKDVPSDGRSILRYLRDWQLPLRGVVNAGAAPTRQAAAARVSSSAEPSFDWPDAAIGAAVAVAAMAFFAAAWEARRRRSDLSTTL